jgi:hypothetical protein
VFCCYDSRVDQGCDEDFGQGSLQILIAVPDAPEDRGMNVVFYRSMRARCALFWEKQSTIFPSKLHLLAAAPELEPASTAVPLGVLGIILFLNSSHPGSSYPHEEAAALTMVLHTYAFITHDMHTQTHTALAVCSRNWRGRCVCVHRCCWAFALRALVWRLRSSSIVGV